MPDHTISAALISYSGPYYLNSTTNVNVGDEVLFRLFYYTGDNNTVHETGGAPNLGGNVASGDGSPAEFTYVVDGTYGVTQTFYFFGKEDGVTSSPLASISLRLNVTDLAACTTAAPTGTLSASIAATESNSTTATLTGLTAGTDCVLYYRSVRGSIVSQWQASNVFAVNRGNTYTFQATHNNYSGSGSASIVSSASTYVPYLDPDLSISVGTASITSSDGEWDQTVSDITGNYNRYTVYKYSTNAWIPMYQTNGWQRVGTGIGGTSINNNQPNNTPIDLTTTYQIWANRTWASGGSGIWQYTNSTFTVTRGTDHSESISNPAGVYFDNYSGTGASHNVILANTTSGWYYNVTNSAGTALFSNWQAGSGTRIATDPAASVPSGTGETSSTYVLWRSSSSNGSSPAQTEDTYSRTLVNYARFTLEDISLSGTTTTFTQTIGNTIAGHTYYIFRGQSLLASVVASGTSTDISVTDTSIPNAGDTATHTLKTQSPYNSSTTTEYSTGVTCTITRTATGEEESGTTPGTFGMEVYASDGTSKLYDTTSRSGRIMASGRVPPTGTIADDVAETVSVTGLQNTTDFNVVALPEVGGSGDSLGAYMGYVFTVTKANGSFTILNESGHNNAYHYYVIKSGGS